MGGYVSCNARVPPFFIYHLTHTVHTHSQVCGILSVYFGRPGSHKSGNIKLMGNILKAVRTVADYVDYQARDKEVDLVKAKHAPDHTFAVSARPSATPLAHSNL